MASLAPSQPSFSRARGRHRGQGAPDSDRQLHVRRRTGAAQHGSLVTKETEGPGGCTPPLPAAPPASSSATPPQHAPPGPRGWASPTPRGTIPPRPLARRCANPPASPAPAAPVEPEPEPGPRGISAFPPPPAGPCCSQAIGPAGSAVPPGRGCRSFTFFTSKRFLPAPLLVPLGVSTSIAAAILSA